MSIVEGRLYDRSTDKMFGNVTFPDKTFDSPKAEMETASRILFYYSK